MNDIVDVKPLLADFKSDPYDELVSFEKVSVRSVTLSLESFGNLMDAIANGGSFEPLFENANIFEISVQGNGISER